MTANATPPPPEGQLGFGTEFEAELGEQILAKVEAATDGAEPYFVHSLKLKNFKGFVDFEARFGRFNVVVGGNNSGKSTLLRAVKMAYDLTRLHLSRYRNELAEFYQGRSVPKHYLPVAQLRDLWPGGKMRKGNEWIPASLELTLTSGHTLGFSIIGPWNAATSRIDDEALKKMNSIPASIIQGFLSKPPEFVPASIGIVAEEEWRTPARRTALASSGRHNEIVRNYLSELTEEQRAELDEILEKYFSAKIDVPKFDEKSDQFLTATYLGKDADHDLYSAGGGFLQVVEVLAFIFRGNPGVVLLDEPDSHLNSSLQHALIDILESLATAKGFQVLLATHSKEIINYVDPSRLLPVDRLARSASPLSNETSTVTVLKELGAIDNADAYQIVKRQMILAVEGPTDRELLPKLAAKLGYTIFDGPTRISLLPTGGVDKLLDGTGIKMIEHFLGKPVKCVLLRDRDGLPDEWITKIQKKSVRSMIVRERDCLESYLISAEAIHAILVEEMGKDKAPALESVKAIIAKALTAVVDIAKDRVSAKIQDASWRLEKVRLESTQTNPEARKIVDSAVTQDGSALRFAHGKELLSSVRQMIQEEFKVSFGNARIIEAMRTEHVPTDVGRVLEQLKTELK